MLKRKGGGMIKLNLNLECTVLPSIDDFMNKPECYRNTTNEGMANWKCIAPACVKLTAPAIVLYILKMSYSNSIEDQLSRTFYKKTTE